MQNRSFPDMTVNFDFKNFPDEIVKLKTRNREAKKNSQKFGLYDYNLDFFLGMATSNFPLMEMLYLRQELARMANVLRLQVISQILENL